MVLVHQLQFTDLHCRIAIRFGAFVVFDPRFLGADSEKDVLHGVHGEAEAKDTQPLLGRVEAFKELGEATLRKL